MAGFSAWHPCALRPAGWLRLDVASNPRAGGGTGAMTSGLEDGVDDRATIVAHIRPIPE